jgi:hypothetical protein
MSEEKQEAIERLREIQCDIREMITEAMELVRQVGDETDEQRFQGIPSRRSGWRWMATTCLWAGACSPWRSASSPWREATMAKIDPCEYGDCGICGPCRKVDAELRHLRKALEEKTDEVEALQRRYQSLTGRRWVCPLRL